MPWGPGAETQKNFDLDLMHILPGMPLLKSKFKGETCSCK